MKSYAGRNGGMKKRVELKGGQMLPEKHDGGNVCQPRVRTFSGNGSTPPCYPTAGTSKRNKPLPSTPPNLVKPHDSKY